MLKKNIKEIHSRTFVEILEGILRGLSEGMSEEISGLVSRNKRWNSRKKCPGELTDLRGTWRDL